MTTSAANNISMDLCTWHYTGFGIEYQLLAGPFYIVLFSISHLPLGQYMEEKGAGREQGGGHKGGGATGNGRRKATRERGAREEWREDGNQGREGSEREQRVRPQWRGESGRNEGRKTTREIVARRGEHDRREEKGVKSGRGRPG